MPILSKSFEKWLYEEVEETFNLQRVENHPLLLTWLGADRPMTELEIAQLTKLQLSLRHQVDNWNEAELKAMFIAPLLLLVDFETAHYKPFWERPLQATIQNIKAHGIVDFMLAAGKQRPKQPYFCLHEYKRAHGHDNDPLGQVLIALVCAQAKNEQADMPIYGLYVEGRFWYFVVLVGHEYEVSLPFDASQEGVWRIFAILRKLKELLQV